MDSANLGTKTFPSLSALDASGGSTQLKATSVTTSAESSLHFPLTGRSARHTSPGNHLCTRGSGESSTARPCCMVVPRGAPGLRRAACPRQHRSFDHPADSPSVGRLVSSSPGRAPADQAGAGMGGRLKRARSAAARRRPSGPRKPSRLTAASRSPSAACGHGEPRDQTTAWHRGRRGDGGQVDRIMRGEGGG